MQALETRVETLERELDAAITASAHARSEKRQTEAAQRAAELRSQELTRELENTTSMGSWINRIFLYLLFMLLLSSSFKYK